MNGQLDPETDDLWPANDWRYAFLQGAKWWEFKSRGATMWQEDQNDARAEAERRYQHTQPEPSGPSGEAEQCTYVDGVNDAQYIVVEALRGTRENFIPTNRALEIADAAIKALKQGRDYRQIATPTPSSLRGPEGERRVHTATCGLFADHGGPCLEVVLVSPDEVPMMQQQEQAPRVCVKCGHRESDRFVLLCEIADCYCQCTFTPGVEVAPEMGAQR